MRGWPRFSRAKPIRTQAAGSETQNYRHNPSNEAQQVSEDGENQSQPPVSLADKYGIKVLHDPPGGTAVVDIVFVHGLTGDREKTWTADTAHDPWVKSFLPTVILTARILSFGYDADILHFLKPAGQNSIGMHAADLVAHLAYQRDTTDSSNRPIIFVAHSLGGLVCEDALLSSKNSVEPHLQRILECARAIAFFGTPHAGSDLTRFALTLTNLAKLFIKKPNNDLLGVLERKSEVLARIQGEFHKMIRARKDTGKPDIKIHCYIEQVPIEGLEKLVVPPESAVLSAYSHSTIHSNHMNMTKFGSQGDSGFILVSGDLLRWVNDLVTLNGRTPGISPYRAYG
ncbi:hypothetical protein F4678DRAFT_419393 [Xylaria arbuscula]|nr:hypothetical protein F4678DRAFT_419393 [Xylaria arbuscula]